jgi:hypothetical protein
VSCLDLVTPHSLAIAVALIAGHVFADFMLQTRRVAEEKERNAGALLWHGALVLVAHLAVMAPVLTWEAAVLLAGVAVLHTATDAVRIKARGGGSIQGFFVDQAVHVAMLLGAWALLERNPAWVGGAAADDWFVWYARCLAVASVYVFNAKGGTIVVRKTLSRYPRASQKLEEDEGGEYEMGRVIGNLERFVVLTLLLFWQWGAIGFVVAAKSIARFPELRERDDKDFTEYYLIGTLTSVLVAIGTAILLKGVLSCFSQ